ncbi:MAG TPA: DUF502 domain-containing protein [Lysobacter sp.]
MPKPSPAPAHRPSLQRLFITGLLTLLPIWLTWVVVKFVFVLLSDISQPVMGPVIQNLVTTYPQTLSWLTEPWVRTVFALLATIAVILFSGVMARRVLGQRMLGWFEALIQRIPLASIVYSSARQLLDILQTKPDGTQRVVLVDFPHKEMKSIGFVTRVIREHGTGRELAAVYVPTTPNPTSGYLEIVPVEKITPTDWSVDQAMSFIISGGAVAPETIPFSPPGQDATPPHAS